MKHKQVWKQYPNKTPISQRLRKDGEIWSIYSWINLQVCAVTVKEVAVKFKMSMPRARRRLEALHKYAYLSKKRATFWNGMHYAVRDYYW